MTTASRYTATAQYHDTTARLLFERGRVDEALAAQRAAETCREAAELENHESPTQGEAHHDR